MRTLAPLSVLVLLAASTGALCGCSGEDASAEPLPNGTGGSTDGSDGSGSLAGDGGSASDTSGTGGGTGSGGNGQAVIDPETGEIAANDPSSLPKPTKGYRWVLQTHISDEFSGTSLDDTKWYDYFTAGWQGRKPAKFVPEAISVGDGTLKIENGILPAEEQVDGWKYSGGAVTSRAEDAHFGYYESKFIASNTRMSSTFWLSNRKEDFTANCTASTCSASYAGCDGDRYSQELDIQECIGNAGDKGSAMRDTMGSNTHFRLIHCGESKETFHSETPPRADLSSEVSEDYHVYAAWWRDATEVTFFADNTEGATQAFNDEYTSTPFNRPMFLCMVTETYDWTSDVIETDLTDSTRNSTYYDWTRSWKLVPVDEDLEAWDYDAAVLDEGVTISSADTAIASGFPLRFDYEFKANADRTLLVSIADAAGVVQQSTPLPAREGHGFAGAELTLDFAPAPGSTYTVTVALQKSEGDGLTAIEAASFIATGS